MFLHLPNKRSRYQPTDCTDEQLIAGCCSPFNDRCAVKRMKRSRSCEHANYIASRPVAGQTCCCWHRFLTWACPSHAMQLNVAGKFSWERGRAQWQSREVGSLRRCGCIGHHLHQESDELSSVSPIGYFGAGSSGWSTWYQRRIRLRSRTMN
mmetsp:Transcript_103018/g.331995  ORF Transcript_103018/g.331995 Transcript_103018/m.331995 type:complete len:152 (+) Transcript_103018:1118-1573(+)